MSQNNDITNITNALQKTDPQTATVHDLHNAIAGVAMEKIRPSWQKSQRAHENSRRTAYLSMEFLVGRAVFNNLQLLGMLPAAKEAFSQAGRDIAELEEIEDAALGNGGLGRLAACFLDSAATKNLPVDGFGIRYRYGIFRQSFEDGNQMESPDDWLRFGDPWSVRAEKESVLVAYRDQTVRAVPYDMPILGCKTDHICTLRLWQAEPTKPFDFALFNAQKYLESAREQITAEDISRVLYPNDDTREGKRLRLKQQYFFSSASLQYLLKKHRETYGTLDNLPDKLQVQLNDTHPVVSIPELIRLLTLPENGYSFDAALEMAKQIFHYTNHTVMPEALEKWDCGLFEELLPEVYSIILRIEERFFDEMYQKNIDRETISRLKIVQNNQIHMANLAVFVSVHTNGVAKIHTEILKTNVLRDWYKIYPERFQNKTNGITPRRWLYLCNSELSELLSELLGTDMWTVDLPQLANLAPYGDDEKVLRRFVAIKHQKKEQLAKYILQKEGIEINPDWLFDVQIKRLHEYKRQLLNAFSILYLYYELKEGNLRDLTPTVYLFGAKAAPGYKRAKGIMKYIHEIAKLVAADPVARQYLQVVFVTDYNVSYAEKLIPAVDVSEQISTAGTEASGTSNMKLMLNGAVTLGTYDGANIEIAAAAGESQNYMFGAKVEELENLMPAYDPRRLVAENKKIRRVAESLIDGTVKDDGSGIFRELYYALLDGASWHAPDNYYVLGDLESYVQAKLRCGGDYKDRLAFAKKQWQNLTHAGQFSSDRTIQDYAENIWGIEAVSLD